MKLHANLARARRESGARHRGEHGRECPARAAGGRFLGRLGHREAQRKRRNGGRATALEIVVVLPPLSVG
jgi:hypothetical protein